MTAPAFSAANDSTCDARWRQLTQEANAAFDAGDHARASARYDEALAEAERIFADELTTPDAAHVIAPTLLTVSTHNLADLARRRGQPDRASALVRDAFDRLVQLAESEAAPLCMRTSAARNLGPALAEVLADLTAQQQTADADALIARACAAAAFDPMSS